MSDRQSSPGPDASLHVRDQGVVYLDDDGVFVAGPGVEVAAGATTVTVSAAGWEVESSLGTAEVLVPPRSRHPQAAFPLVVEPYESARWMMTRDEVLAEARALLGGAALDPASLVLRPFATVDGTSVWATGAVRLDGIVPPAAPASPERGPTAPVSLHDLARWERKVSSQNGEDGVIEAIFATIGTTNRCFVEFGCGPGVECNGARLLAQGWNGLLMDAFHESENPLADIKDEFVTAENIQALLERYGIPEEFDLISIDVDGNDYWIWQRITSRPRVVVIEYNAHVSPRLSRTVRYDPEFRWGSTDYVGASLRALRELGRSKGYTLVHCERNGVNAFFVADEWLPDGFVARPIEQIHRRPNYLGLGLAFPHEPLLTMVDPSDSEDPSD